MLILETNEQKEEKNLVLGDYVTVHVSEAKESENPTDMGVLLDLQVQNKGFLHRIQQERKELSEMPLRGAA